LLAGGGLQTRVLLGDTRVADDVALVGYGTIATVLPRSSVRQ